jgi:NADH-quinone oxidoreductase subunit J
MTGLFYVAAAVTLLATVLAVTRANPVHALLNFVVSLIGMGVVFYTLGAAFAAAIEVIVYAGAIMVLFLFVVMMLSLDVGAARRERGWIARSAWAAPLLFVGLFAGEVALGLRGGLAQFAASGGVVVSPQAVGLRLFTHDLAAVELASLLLLAALIGAYHLGRPAAGKR